MFGNVLADNPWQLMPQISLILFFVFSCVVSLWLIFRPNAKAHYQSIGETVLDAEDKVVSKEEKQHG